MLYLSINLIEKKKSVLLAIIFRPHSCTLIMYFMNVANSHHFMECGCEREKIHMKLLSLLARNWLIVPGKLRVINKRMQKSNNNNKNWLRKKLFVPLLSCSVQLTCWMENLIWPQVILRVKTDLYRYVACWHTNNFFFLCFITEKFHPALSQVST